MPLTTGWVESEELLTHNDITVYFTYQDEQVQVFHYALDMNGDEEFDIRDLPAYDQRKANRVENYLDYHAEVIHAAIDSGDLPE